MCIHRLHAQMKPVSDLLGRETVAKRLEDLELPVAQFFNGRTFCIARLPEKISRMRADILSLT